jgi:pentatricopeptide repeat protein
MLIFLLHSLAAKRAEDILRIMLKLYTEGHEDIRPDGISLSTVLSAYTRPPLTLNEEILGHFESLIDLLLNESGNFPDTDPEAVLRLFNIILDMIAKSNLNHAGEKANIFLKRLVDASLTHPNLKPDTVTYSNVIGAYIKDDAIEEAVSILHDIIDGTEERNLRPDVYCFNKCLNYYCKHRNVEAAEELYRTMYELGKENHSQSTKDQPVLDITTFNMMMEMYMSVNVHSLSDQEEMTDKAIKLLGDMENTYSCRMIISLDMFPYEVVLDRLQKRSAEKFKSTNSLLSYDILMKMIALYNDGHLPQLPHRLSFNSVLSSLSKEYTKEAAEKAMVSS